MAGDWIKMRIDLADSPEFIRICGELGASEGDVLMALHRSAAWFARQSSYGFMRSEEASLLDYAVNAKGLYSALLECGWAKEQEGMTALCGFCSPMKDRKSIGSSVRSAVLSAGACAACGCTSNLVVDHITPVAKGGGGEISNLQCLCAACNRRKWTMSMSDFLAMSEAA